MADVLLFHHVQGLTAGVVAFADELRRAGHTVHTPDLFDGRTFETVEDGIAFAQQTGFGTLVERGVRAADDLPTDIVYAGFSFGVIAAQQLAQTRTGARGALFYHSCVPASEFESPWPAGLPAQIHGMDADPYFVDEGDIDAARDLAAAEENVELFVYPGDKHLFADSSQPSYDPDAAALLMRRTLELLAAVEERPRN